MQLDDLEPEGKTKKKILFVDDEKRVLDGLRRILRGERGEWDITFANSVDEALEVLSDVDHDAVISDVNMPIRDGLDLLQAIRANERTADIPVVILTGNGEPDMKRRALDMGATDLLAKPVVREDLIARIHSVLRLKGYMDEIKNHGKQLEERVRLRTAELEYSRAEVIWRLGKAGEFRDSDTGFHVVRVGLISQELAKALDLEDAQVREIFLSAPLHDIGKIGIPDKILLKPGKLNPEEWEIMKTHTNIGGQILRAEPMAELHSSTLRTLTGIEGFARNPFANTGASIAESHHERWDGSGYPRGLRGNKIPIEARITTVADVYDALCSKRPYKPAFSEDEVLKIMLKGVGSQFDPEVFDAFQSSLSILREIRTEFGDSEESELHADGDESLSGLLG